MSGKAACRLQKCLRSKRHTRFACTGGAAPRRPGKCRTAACLLRRQQGYPPQAARIKFGLCDTAMQCAASRFAKPRNSIAREACRLDRGRLSACQKVSKRETDCYFLRRAKSNTKSTRGSTLRPRFKTLWKNIFRDISSIRLYTGMWCDPLFRMF